MSTTSVLYYQDSSLIPGLYDSTFALDRQEAQPNIKKYHRNQFLFLTLNELLQRRQNGKEFSKAEALLGQTTPEPMEIALYDSDSNYAHSVAAYKTLRLVNRNSKILFFYDPNTPFVSGKASSGSQFTLGDQDQFSYDGYDRFYANEVKAGLLTDQKILELLLPRAKRQQVLDDVITAVVGSPVEPLFIDAQGRKSRLRSRRYCQRNSWGEGGPI